ncbi:MAG: hypothetical protein HY057_05440 [Rhodospirillales bacterium]|nr:hypothetical protein [Rhodospirillales bacterium]
MTGASPCRTRPLAVLTLAGLLLWGGSAHGQVLDRAFEAEIAREFLALELAGWRLPDPTEGDRRRRLVRFEWLLVDGDGAPRAIPDSFVFVINDTVDARPAAAMLREPAHMIIRRECFPG